MTAVEIINEALRRIGQGDQKPEPKVIDLRADAHITRQPDGTVLSSYTPPVVFELDDIVKIDNPFW